MCAFSAVGGSPGAEWQMRAPWELALAAGILGWPLSCRGRLKGPLRSHRRTWRREAWRCSTGPLPGERSAGSGGGWPRLGSRHGGRRGGWRQSAWTQASRGEAALLASRRLFPSCQPDARPPASSASGGGRREHKPAAAPGSPGLTLGCAHGSLRAAVPPSLWGHS